MLYCLCAVAAAGFWAGPYRSPQPSYDVYTVSARPPPDLAHHPRCSSGRTSCSSLCSAAPTQRLQWHAGAASFARFAGRDCATTAAIDGAIAVWDLTAPSKTLTAPRRVLRGHRNTRNFVGLSVLHDGSGRSSFGPSHGHVLACGSEDCVVHAYHTGSSVPLATWPLLPDGSYAATNTVPFSATPFSGGKDDDAAIVPAAAPRQPVASGGLGCVPSGRNSSQQPAPGASPDDCPLPLLAPFAPGRD